jgi:hypothetical protein
MTGIVRTLATHLRSAIIPAGISLLLLLLVDFLAGATLLDRFTPNPGAYTYLNHEQYRIAHPVYHHTLASGFDGTGVWGQSLYRICTNDSGFKSSCEPGKAIGGKSFDLAFIGDSFTEGVGLTYEQSYVGQIGQALAPLRVANLAVTSYSPSIYLSKLRQLLENGYKFKELVVYVDISDVQDEAVEYITDGKRVLSNPKTQRFRPVTIAQRVGAAFPLVSRGLARIKSLVSAPEPQQSTDVLARDYERSAWTYNTNIAGYGSLGVSGAINKSLGAMTDLHELLNMHGIKLTIGVYPWPAQLLYDVESSRQVEIWRQFCEQRCHVFVNSFPSFFEYFRERGRDGGLQDLFIPGDVHFTLRGNELVAQDFVNAYRTANE